MDEPCTLTKGDLICCPSCGSGLWWVSTRIGLELGELWQVLTPINTDVPKPNKAPIGFLDRKTWLPNCPFCNSVTVTEKNEILVLQHGMVEIILPYFGL